MPGTTYNAPAVDLYTITQQPSGTIPEAGGTADVYCTSAYPGGLVAKALSGGSFASDAQWYTLSVRSGRAVVATADGIRTQGQTRQLAKGNMWTFVKEDGNPDGFKVYNLLKGAASREDNVITLTEIENGEVPAMTPVVIAAEPATYTLDILAEAPAGVESNLLSGSLLPYDIQESPAYIFGVDEEGTPTFYRVADDDSSQLGANKAYFAPQGDSAASRYILRFGNEGTTGIQGVGTADEAESETYYDLSGRRVLYPAKGIYVTGSGKKVFLK